MTDDIKRGFPIKSGGYFPRRYLVPRHRAQTLYSAPYKEKSVAAPEVEPLPARKSSSAPLRLRVEQLFHQEVTDPFNQKPDTLLSVATTEIAGNKS